MNPDLLVSTRKSLHQAVQIVSAFPRNILPPDSSDTTASLIWNSRFKGLESLPYPNNKSKIKVGFSFKKFELLIIVDEEINKSYSLVGVSVNEGIDWLKDNLKQLGVNAKAIDLDVPYEIENYDFSKPLNINEAALEVYAQLYDNAQNILENVAINWGNAEDIRCWPHHFDIATLIPLEKNSSGEVSKSIGVGLSPGDNTIEEPYFYVNAWPNIDYNAASQQNLSNGYWNKQGWTGAVLPYSSQVNISDLKTVNLFVNEATTHLSKLQNS